MISLPHRLNFLRRITASVLAAALALPAAAQFTVPSDGSDGVLNVTSNRTINLGLATTGEWNTPGNGNGVYDPNQWIVVFKYQSVNIDAGRQVWFANHPKNPPVVWLVQGNVTINGNLNLHGAWGWANPPYSPGGPGGFRGGRRADILTPGFGPGAGLIVEQGLSQGQSYMNASCFPLIGGSGSSHTEYYNSMGGGGGAILIAATGTITINGYVNANGGQYRAGGGMIRLVAPTINGSGFLYATEWRTWLGDPQYYGRVRVEANTIGFANPSVPLYSTGTLGTQLRFLRDDLTPSARIVSIDETAAPADPGTAFSPDVAVTTENRKPRITVECRNVPESSVVKVYFRTTTYGMHTVVNAVKTGGNDALSTWLAIGDLGPNEGYSTVQARVILPNP